MFWFALRVAAASVLLLAPSCAIRLDLAGLDPSSGLGATAAALSNVQQARSVPHTFDNATSVTRAVASEEREQPTQRVAESEVRTPSGKRLPATLNQPDILVKDPPLDNGRAVTQSSVASASISRLMLQFFWREGSEIPRYFLSFAIWSAFAILVAGHNDLLKRKLWTPPADGLEHTLKAVDGGWKYGPFACLADPAICGFTALCASVRWADTMRMAGLFDFWCAIGSYVIVMLNILLLAIGFLHGGLPAWLVVNLGITLWFVLVVVQVDHRQKLREMFHMERSTRVFVEDYFMHCFCPLCAICQEARHIEEAHAVGHPAIEEAYFDRVAPSYR